MIKATRLIAIAVVMMIATPARADEARETFVKDLGTIMAAEKPCGLIYVRAAIEALIGQHIAPTDMSFPRELEMRTWISKGHLEELTESALFAHCFQISRLAKQHKLINE